jgi:hypothetical protein
MRRITMMLVLASMSIATSVAQTRQDLQYDDLGRVSQVSFTQGEQRLVIHYEYDNRNNITRKRTEVVSSVDEHSPVLTLSVAPNPTQSDVALSYRWQPDQGASVTLTDISGVVRHRALLRTDAAGVAHLAIDVRDLALPSGRYTVTVYCGDKQTSAPLVIAR